MTSIMKSDVFFFITSIVVACVGVLFIIILLYAIRIIRTVDTLSKKVHEEGQEVVNDFHAFRMKVKNEGVHFSHVQEIFSFARKMMKGRVSRRKSPKEHKEKTQDTE